MSKQHPYRSIIPPVPEGSPSPLWSVMIPTYNCAGYLRETLASVLAQDPGPEVMQIEVVDDHSTLDDPEAVVRELAGDRVSFYRQPKNVGYIQNFNTCLARSRGQFIHLLHGDDCVQVGFYEKIHQVFQANPEVGAVFSRVIFINEKGEWQNFSSSYQNYSGVLERYVERLVTENPIQTPSIVVKRDVYEAIGGFDRRFTCCCEDWEMWVRIALHYPIGYVPEPLALYRMARQGSLSKNAFVSGAYSKDIRQASEIARPTLAANLPALVANDLFKRSKDAGARGILYVAQQMLEAENFESVLTQLKLIVGAGYSFETNRRSFLLWQKSMSKLIFFKLRSKFSLN
jgi:GT2 family glycosyltransferase